MRIVAATITTLTFLAVATDLAAQNPVPAQATIWYRRNGVNVPQVVLLGNRLWVPEHDPWNGRVTTLNNRIENLDTTGLAFPIDPNDVNITAAEVEAYWNQHYPTTPLSGPSMDQNCHGFSTGLGYWCHGIAVVLADDWQSCAASTEFAAGSLYLEDGGAHSVTVTGVLKYGDYQGVIIQTEEKNGPSGVYRLSWPAPAGAPVAVSNVYRKKP